MKLMLLFVVNMQFFNESFFRLALGFISIIVVSMVVIMIAHLVEG